GNYRAESHAGGADLLRPSRGRGGGADLRFHAGSRLAGGRRFSAHAVWSGAVSEARRFVKRSFAPKSVLRLPGLERAAVSSRRRSRRGAAYLSGKQRVDPAGGGVQGGGC